MAKSPEITPSEQRMQRRNSGLSKDSASIVQLKQDPLGIPVAVLGTITMGVQSRGIAGAVGIAESAVFPIVENMRTLARTRNNTALIRWALDVELLDRKAVSNKYELGSFADLPDEDKITFNELTAEKNWNKSAQELSKHIVVLGVEGSMEAYMLNYRQRLMDICTKLGIEVPSVPDADLIRLARLRVYGLLLPRHEAAVPVEKHLPVLSPSKERIRLRTQEDDRGLTKVEVEILERRARGQTTRQIMIQLRLDNYSFRTMDSRMKRMIQKRGQTMNSFVLSLLDEGILDKAKLYTELELTLGRYRRLDDQAAQALNILLDNPDDSPSDLANQMKPLPIEAATFTNYLSKAKAGIGASDNTQAVVFMYFLPDQLKRHFK